MLDDREMEALKARCLQVPMTTNVYIARDVVSALLETVIDYQQNTTTVRRAIEHFDANRRSGILSFEELQGSLAKFPDTKEGNIELALFLWGYRLWTRAQQLRGLVDYFDDLEITTLDGMREWAQTTTFEDFQGKVEGLGPAVYQWLVMRLGIETVKPDVHVLRFVSGAIGRPVSESEAVGSLEQAARELDLKPQELDWSIWEFMRGSD